MNPIPPLMTFLLFCQSFVSFVSQPINSWNQNPTYPATDPRAGRWTSRLGKPLIGDDGLVYSCSGNKLYAFRGNGTIAWMVQLMFPCHSEIAPVYGGDGIIYFVTENSVLKILPRNMGSSEPLLGSFVNPEMDHPGSGEIIGVTSSIITSSVYINIRHHGIIAYSFRGKIQWETRPVLNQFGYLQSCRRNVTDCYFNSPVVIDHCEGSIHVSNNQGEVYSLSVRNGRLKWIQDFSSFFNDTFIMTPGNNGRVYITIPAKSVVFALDVSNGDILWRNNIGPLSSTEYEPVVDANGWISVGSLDGFLYSFSPTGKKFVRSSSSDSSVIQVSPILDCSGYAIYISETEMEGRRSIIAGDYNFVSILNPRNTVFTLLVPATGSLYWSERYKGPFTFNLSHSDLQSFRVDEAIILTFIAALNAGNPLSCRSTSSRMAPSCSGVRSKSLSVYTADERTIFLFLIIQTAILAALAIIVRFCWIFWSKKKLQDRGLDQFLEKRRSLRLMKKDFDQTIKELEQKVTEESIPGVIDELRDIVREREGVEKKLSTIYSLGQDNTVGTAEPSKSILPLYSGQERSHSFKTRSGKESVTIFHSESDSDCSSYEGSSEAEEDGKEEELEDLSGKGKKPIQALSSSEDDEDESEGNDGGGYDYDGDGDFSSFGSGLRGENMVRVNSLVVSGGAGVSRGVGEPDDSHEN